MSQWEITYTSPSATAPTTVEAAAAQLGEHWAELVDTAGNTVWAAPRELVSSLTATAPPAMAPTVTSPATTGDRAAAPSAPAA